MGAMPTRPEIELVEAALGCAVAPGSATYVSMPLTTGRRFADWFRRTGQSLAGEPAAYERAHRAEVLEPNARHGAALVARLRAERMASGGGPVIDPSGLDVPGLSQPEYLDLWCRVIRRFAAEVVFADGWEYSAGCAQEFAVAQAEGLATRDERGRDISLAQGTAAVEAAALELDQVEGGYHARLHAAAAALRDMVGRPHRAAGRRSAT